MTDSRRINTPAVDPHDPQQLRWVADFLQAWMPDGRLTVEASILHDEANDIERMRRIDGAAEVIIWKQQGVRWSEADDQQKDDARLLIFALEDNGYLAEVQG